MDSESGRSTRTPTRISRWRRPARVAVALGLLLAVYRLLSLDAHGIDAQEFERTALRVLGRARRITWQVAAAPPGFWLDRVAAAPGAPFHYRLDDHLAEAKPFPETAEPPEAARRGPIFALEFEDAAASPLQGDDSSHRIEAGVLRVEQPRVLLWTRRAGFDAEQAGELELRARLDAGRKLMVGWAGDADADPEGPDVGWIEVDVVADGAFHVYRVDLTTSHTLKPLPFRGRVEKLFLRPSNALFGTVEIDYVRFLSRWQRFEGSRSGVACERIGRESRHALFVHTPLALRYPLDLPPGPVKLEFGMGRLGQAPVDFRVVVRDAAGEAQAFLQTVRDARWHDAAVDLSPWAGRRVELSLESRSSGTSIAFWSNPSVYVPPRSRTNVIVILEDALRADHLSGYGYGRATAAARQVLVEGGVRFDHAFSQATKTRPSVPSLMTSLYPTTTGVWDFGSSLHENYVTLAEVLRSRGYATASFIQNGNAGPLFGLQQGFGHLFDEEALGGGAERLYGSELDAWLETHADRNFFLYLHLIDPHGPYDPPPRFRSFFEERANGSETSVYGVPYLDPPWDERPTVESRRARYDGEIARNDQQFGRFWGRLLRARLLRDTLVVLLADHGEHLGEHTLWEHNPPGYGEVLHVPLLFYFPKKLPRGVSIDEPVQLVDVMPTILELAGIDPRRLPLQGDSLVPLMRGRNERLPADRLVLSEEVVYQHPDHPGGWGSIFLGRWHVLHSRRLDDVATRALGVALGPLAPLFLTTRVYDYLDDTAELRPRGALSDRAFSRAARHFLERLQQQNLAIRRAVTGGEQTSRPVDPAEIERLRALGYLR